MGHEQRCRIGSRKACLPAISPATSATSATALTMLDLSEGSIRHKEPCFRRKMRPYVLRDEACGACGGSFFATGSAGVIALVPLTESLHFHPPHPPHPG